MQLGFYFDQSRCIGCHTCSVACADWHDTGEETKWLRVTTIEQGDFPDVFVSFLVLPCCHCEQPGCVEACPAGAISKRADNGIVVVDQELCLGKDGCGLCLEACPYHVPRFGAGDNAKMQKCDMCVERIERGQQPVCIEACPMWALDFGPMDKLRSDYSGSSEAVGFVSAPGTSPAILFKPKRKSTT